MHTHMKINHMNNIKTQIILQTINMTANGYYSTRADNESREPL